MNPPRLRPSAVGEAGYAHAPWNTRAAVVLLGIVLVLAVPARACVPPLQGEGVRLMQSAAHAVAWRPEPPAISVSEPFALELGVCALGGRTARVIGVDAHMPEHRHGMNYRPRLTALGDGRWRAEGLLFHMPGRWRLVVEIRDSNAVDRLTHDLVIE